MSPGVGRSGYRGENNVRHVLHLCLTAKRQLEFGRERRSNIEKHHAEERAAVAIVAHRNPNAMFQYISWRNIKILQRKKTGAGSLIFSCMTSSYAIESVDFQGAKVRTQSKEDKDSFRGEGGARHRRRKEPTTLPLSLSPHKSPGEWDGGGPLSFRSFA